jgi:hypothetical protein
MIQLASNPLTPSPRHSAEENDRLADEIAELAAHLHAATYRLLVLLREYDAREAWGWGFRSCAHWLSWRTGIAPGAAREKVRVARALGSLPRISAAMERGELSYSKVRALTRVATPENEESLLEVARCGTASHVERLVRAWRKLDAQEEAAEERLRHDRRYVSLYPSEDGSWELRGRLDPEVGAVLEKALEWASEQLYGRRPTPETSAGQRRADALGLVAEQALAEGPIKAGADTAAPRGPPPARGRGAEAGRSTRGGFADVPAGTVEEAPVGGPADANADAAAPSTPPLRPVPKRADRFQVVLHVEQPSGSAAPAGHPACGHPTPEQSAHGQAVLATTGHRVPAETWRRLACDCSVVEMTHDLDGSVLDVGRKRRSIPPAIRRALDHRDRKCRFPGCDSRYCDAHHVEHWADGGATKLDNLIRLCRIHHRAVHEDGFGLELGEDGEVRFRAPGGWLVPEVPAPPPLTGDGAAVLRAANERAGLVIDPWTPTPDWHGEPLDLDWAIYVMRNRRPHIDGDARSERDGA